MPGSMFRRERARRSRRQKAWARFNRSSLDFVRGTAPARLSLVAPATLLDAERTQGLETSGACRRRLQAGAFSHHSRRAAANWLLRGARGELHGRRRAAACAACRVAPTLCLVAPRRWLVDRLDAAARP